MEEKKLNSWEDFEKALLVLENETNDLRSKTERHISTPIFRGQENAEWGLDSTLERYLDKKIIPLRKYEVMIKTILPNVNIFTNNFLDISPELKIKKREDFISSPENFKTLEYMTWLRHYGFPSPLIDWTKSPYIAAFFAFFPKPKPDVKEVAIYSFFEFLGEGKSGWEGEEQIMTIATNIKSDKRHFNQQSEYSLCFKKKNEDVWVYGPHEEAVKRGNGLQDRLIKITLPVSERDNILKNLGLMNINSFSLFGDTDSLMRLLAYREMELKKGIYGW